MNAPEREIADRLITQGINLLRIASGYQRGVVTLLRELEADLVGKLSGRELTLFSRQRLLDLLADTRTIIARKYVEIRKSVDHEAIAVAEAARLQQTFQVAAQLTVGLPSAFTLKALIGDVLIEGAPSAEWWSRQGQDTAFRFAGAVRVGVAQGETNAQIVQRIRGTKTQAGIMEISRRNAEALVRTSVQTVANVSRMAVFRANDDVIEGVRQLSTLDGRTSDTCIAYSGAEWDLQGNPIRGTTLPFNGGPPRHWNCRSVLTPIVEPIPGFKSQRASMDGPVRGDITFTEWLDTKSKAFQDETLGKGKAQLWRDGKITLQQLLDQRGRPLTLEQLQERYDN